MFRSLTEWVPGFLGLVVISGTSIGCGGSSSATGCEAQSECDSRESSPPEVSKGGPGSGVAGNSAAEAGGNAKLGTGGRSDSAAAGSGGAASSGAGTSGGATAEKSDRPACQSAGKKRCATAADSKAFQCLNGFWEAYACPQNSLCDSRTGECSGIAEGCARALPGQEVCHDGAKVVCGPDLVTSEVQLCEGACAHGECLPPRCGDDLVQSSEECDDANLIETDDCRSDCTRAKCGDGVVQQGAEECDDGNDVNTDACTSRCKLAACGDGMVRERQEECDDSNRSEGDGCSAECRAEPVALALGSQHSCARFSDGRVKCWGDNHYDQVGDTSDDRVGDHPTELGAKLETNITRVSQLAAGNYHTCVVQEQIVHCWGANHYRQLGPGATESTSARPVPIALEGAAKQVCGTAYATFALLDDGAVYGWGARHVDDDGRIELAPFDGDTASISCGDLTVCALSSRGLVECWGDLGPTFEQTAPLKVSLDGREGLETVQQLTYGVDHGCALYEGGAVRCWGSNDFGALFTGDTIDRAGDLAVSEDWAPIEMDLVSSAIASGGGTSCAIGHTAAGSDVVKCWGFDTRSGALGQPELTAGPSQPLGDVPSETGRGLPPIALGDGPRPKVIATSGYHTCAILRNGRIKCWGYNEYGQLGIGTADFAIGDEIGEMGDALRYSSIE